MAVYNVLNNGNAPSNAQIGDTIKTAGGTYNIVAPGTNGATFNPSSGYWSVKSDLPEYLQSAKALTNVNNQLLEQSANSANAISKYSSAKQYEFNSKEAQKNRDFQLMMSNTSYQRAVEDLKKAGLNPVLAAMNGGASTGSGATATGGSYQGQKAEVDTNLLGLYGTLMNTMLNNNTQKDIAKIQAETALQTASINSAASMYSANQSYNSSKYSADVSSLAQKYSSDNSAKSGSWLNRSVNSLIEMNNLVDKTSKVLNKGYNKISEYYSK